MDEVAPDLVVDTGDVSGVPGPWQALFLGIYLRITVPYVFAPGNHDGARTSRLMKRHGATVLDRPRTIDVAGLRIWGYPDPNRTRWGVGDTYSVDLARKMASEHRPPDAPVVVAVHSHHMVQPSAATGLVLCGHVHTPRVWVESRTTFMRPGSSGGGGPFGSALCFGVVDVDSASHRPVAGWFVRYERADVTYERVL